MIWKPPPIRVSSDLVELLSGAGPDSTRWVARVCGHTDVIAACADLDIKLVAPAYERASINVSDELLKICARGLVIAHRQGSETITLAHVLAAITELPAGRIAALMARSGLTRDVLLAISRELGVNVLLVSPPKPHVRANAFDSWLFRRVYSGDWLGRKAWVRRRLVGRG